MSAPGYHRRGQTRRMRDLTGLRDGAYSTHEIPPMTAGPKGPAAKVAWAIQVIKMWREAVRDGKPAAEMSYPPPPAEGKMKVWREK